METSVSCRILVPALHVLGSREEEREEQCRQGPGGDCYIDSHSGVLGLLVSSTLGATGVAGQGLNSGPYWTLPAIKGDVLCGVGH